MSDDQIEALLRELISAIATLSEHVRVVSDDQLRVHGAISQNTKTVAEFARLFGDYGA